MQRKAILVAVVTFPGFFAVADDQVSLGPFLLDGSITQRYRFRKSSEFEDQDVYGYLNLEGQYPARSSDGSKPYSKLGFNLQGSYNLDIDSFQTGGASPSSSFFPFFDIKNTFSDRFHAFLYQANLEVDDILVFERMRLGRQMIHRQENILFDGGFLKTRRWNKLSLNLYGGVPAHLYESSAAGDALGGGGVDFQPLRSLDFKVDYFYIRDERRLVPDSEEHLYMISSRYRFLKEWDITGSASWVDTRDRRQLLSLRYLSQASGFMARLRALRQNGIVGFQTSELSPYLFIEGNYAPYYQYELDLHQPFAEKFGVGGGLNIRHLETRSDKGLYNHDFGNYYLSLDAERLWPGMRVSVRGDIWDSDADDIYTASFELEQKVLEIARVRVGTSYSFYRIDLFDGRERDRDRVYYVKVRWKALKHLDIDTEYQYEKDSDSEYHIVLGGFTVWF